MAAIFSTSSTKPTYVYFFLLYKAYTICSLPCGVSSASVGLRASVMGFHSPERLQSVSATDFVDAVEHSWNWRSTVDGAWTN